MIPAAMSDAGHRLKSRLQMGRPGRRSVRMKPAEPARPTPDPPSALHGVIFQGFRPGARLDFHRGVLTKRLLHTKIVRTNLTLVRVPTEARQRFFRPPH